MYYVVDRYKYVDINLCIVVYIYVYVNAYIHINLNEPGDTRCQIQDAYSHGMAGAPLGANEKEEWP